MGSARAGGVHGEGGWRGEVLKGSLRVGTPSPALRVSASRPPETGVRS